MDESVFVNCAACGDLDEVKSLLASEDPLLTSAVINKVDKDGKSAFHYACLNDDSNLLAILLKDARVDVFLTSKSGDTAFHMAALYAAMEALTLLKNDGRLNINSQNKYGETPLHLCAGSGDKGACKTAELLLSFGASLSVTDKWNRGPLDVSYDNAENLLLKTLKDYLSDPSRCSEEERLRVEAVSEKYKADREREVAAVKEASDAKSKTAGKLLFGNLPAFGGGGGDGNGNGLGGLFSGVKLKKTTTVLKTMFSAGEGKTTGDQQQLQQQQQAPSDGRKALSKLIDFPGDFDEIRKWLDQPELVDPAAKDSYGLTALHKFSSWNKSDYLDVLIPRLNAADLEMKCPEGKTALHYAVEMASVAAVKKLISAGANLDAVDGKGMTVKAILDAAPASGVIDRLKIAITKPESI
jgi:ankyrin repeat protein